jgi:hypothetical protein
MKIKILWAALVPVLLCAGCSQHLGSFSALSTGIYNPQRINSASLVKRDATGSASTFRFMGLSANSAPKLEDAVADALAKNNGDFMADTIVNSKYYWFIIFDVTIYEVRGDVYRTH